MRKQHIAIQERRTDASSRFAGVLKNKKKEKILIFAYFKQFLLF